ncbi:MAG TPA: T9SS type A sorting domain-containing protein, partial [Flavobacterium sp.]
GSHGYIAYRIKTTNGLDLGDSVAQSADIYFDFNFPIVTNEAITTVASLGVGQFDASMVAIYPNPTKNLVTITSDNFIKTVGLYDLQGRLLDSHNIDSVDFAMDISSRSRGIYLLKIETTAGIKTEKLIKE